MFFGPSKQVAKDNAQVECSGQRAVIAGGTQGIGAGIALRFAHAGAAVWIIGRNEQKANEVLKLLREASIEAQRRGLSKTSAGDEHAFFQADLSSPKEIKRVADELKRKADERGIDYLVETQGGPPNGKFVETPEGHELHFAVQCLSRFGLAYFLTKENTIKRGISIIASPGSGGKTLDVDDLELVKAKEQGKYGLLRMGVRDSAVLDSVTQSLAERNPSLSVSHLFPGFVQTDGLANQDFPSWLVQLGKLGAPLVATKPEAFAEVPFHLLASPEGQRYIRAGEANLFGPSLKRYSMSKCVDKKSTRDKVWEKLADAFAGFE